MLVKRVGARVTWFIWGLFLYITSSFSSELYFLCGPDEDGCFDNEYAYCACIPYNHTVNTRYCLDFSTVQCKPLSEVSSCPAHLIYSNQGDCIATIFHSTPLSPCRVMTREFCLQHHIMFCDHNAEPINCHRLPEG